MTPPRSFPRPASPQPPGIVQPVELRDGRIVVLRPLLPSDEAAYRTFTATVSDEAQYYRFFSPKKGLSDAEVSHFLHVDFIDRVALVAAHGDEVVAVARYDREPDSDVAEVAFIVRDDFQGQSIAPRLMGLLADVAKTQGMTVFTASVLPHNQKMMRVFIKSGRILDRRLEDGVIHVTLALDPPVNEV